MSECDRALRYWTTFESLPHDQGGVGRHRCAGCAYEKGLTDGLERKEQLDLGLDDLEKCHLKTTCRCVDVIGDKDITGKTVTDLAWLHGKPDDLFSELIARRAPPGAQGKDKRTQQPSSPANREIIEHAPDGFLEAIEAIASAIFDNFSVLDRLPIILETFQHAG